MNRYKESPSEQVLSANDVIKLVNSLSGTAKTDFFYPHIYLDPDPSVTIFVGRTFAR